MDVWAESTALVEAWSEAARRAAAEARRRGGHRGVVALAKSGEHPPARIARVVPDHQVRGLIEHIEKHQDRKDPKVRKLHAALKQRLAPAPEAAPDMQTHLAQVVADYRKRQPRTALAHALMVEATFSELLHPRGRGGKFREKMGVVRRPLRDGEFPLGQRLAEPRSDVKPDQVHNAGKASPPIRTHMNEIGPGGKPRNVKAMGDKKLRLLLTHPSTHPELRARVEEEIRRRGGEAAAGERGHIAGSASTEARPSGRPASRRPSAPPAPTKDDLMARLPSANKRKVVLPPSDNREFGAEVLNHVPHGEVADLVRSANDLGFPKLAAAIQGGEVTSAHAEDLGRLSDAAGSRAFDRNEFVAARMRKAQDHATKLRRAVGAEPGFHSLGRSLTYPEERTRDIGGGVRTHTSSVGDAGKPRNVRAMGERKLRALLDHPDTGERLYAAVTDELRRRGLHY